MPINFDTALGNHVAALRIRARRAELLASNLANADTPNYKARDIDFRAALQQAQQGGGLGLVTDNPRQIRTAGQSQPGGEALYRVPSQPALDGNTVDVQVERAAFADNAVRYEATLQFLGGRFKSMIQAITGK
ncbi:MAG: flagellar basal body rod protein FlgB [Gammaproteobacteria bacterium]